MFTKYREANIALNFLLSFAPKMVLRTCSAYARPHHLLLSLPENGELALIIGAWKKWSATSTKIQWQRNFFDHRIRREESLDILQNPVRAGLVESARDWPYVFMPHAGRPPHGVRRLPTNAAAKRGGFQLLFFRQNIANTKP